MYICNFVKLITWYNIKNPQYNLVYSNILEKKLHDNNDFKLIS